MTDKGFHNPAQGYWQTDGDVSQEIIAAYPADTVEVSLRPSSAHDWDGAEWVLLPADPAAILAAERKNMTCTPMQGILALGEANWNQVLAYRDTYANWAEKVIIDSASEWVRNSQNTALFQYLLNLTDEQVDDLFRVAMQINV